MRLMPDGSWESITPQVDWDRINHTAEVSAIRGISHGDQQGPGDPAQGTVGASPAGRAQPPPGEPGGVERGCGLRLEQAELIAITVPVLLL
jgi:hypothetical protein